MPCKNNGKCVTHMESLLIGVRDALVLGFNFPTATSLAARVTIGSRSLRRLAMANHEDVVDLLMEALSDEVPARMQKATPKGTWPLQVWDKAKRRTQAERIDLVLKAMGTAREAHKLLHQSVDEVVQRALGIINGKVKPGDPCTSSSKSSSSASRE
jgi:hypothetical protein